MNNALRLILSSTKKLRVSKSIFSNSRKKKKNLLKWHLFLNNTTLGIFQDIKDKMMTKLKKKRLGLIQRLTSNTVYTEYGKAIMKIY